MKNFTQATMIALLFSTTAFSQTQSKPTPTTKVTQSKAADKELDKNQPKMQGDPVHGVDIKLGVNGQDKELDKNQPAKSTNNNNSTSTVPSDLQNAPKVKG